MRSLTLTGGAGAEGSAALAMITCRTVPDAALMGSAPLGVSTTRLMRLLAAHQPASFAVASSAQQTISLT
jgi:hypothetical protein